MDDLRISLIQRVEREKKEIIKIRKKTNKERSCYDKLIDDYDKFLYNQYVELSKDIEQELEIFEKLKKG